MLVQNTLILGLHEFFKKKSKDKFNGYEYVDLGLPSGTLWAKMNVGAESETDYGLYFAWGETKGYTASQIPNEKRFQFNDADYKFSPSGYGGSTMTKYNSTDGKTKLDLEDDAAHVNMGGDWHMPTKEQCEELLNTEYVTNEWVENYNSSGINGNLLTSVSNGNTLFIPATGFGNYGRIDMLGNYGYAWTSTLFSDDVKKACGFNAGSAVLATPNDLRCYGRSVRGVIGEIENQR